MPETGDGLPTLRISIDLYKHAFRPAPLIPSELVADCFELARDIRVLDMRASPHDLSALDYDQVRVETTEGKQESPPSATSPSEVSRCASGSSLSADAFSASRVAEHQPHLARFRDGC